MAEMMKAWQFTTAAGGLEKNLTLNDAAIPPSKLTLSQNDILVEVISAALNPVDYKIPELGMLSRAMVSVPASPGIDYCGRVVATHNTNDALQVGQKVFGRLESPTKFGTCAQYIVAPVQGCVPLPDGVDPDQGAAVGCVGSTAYQSLKPYIKEGSKVFINGGSGGTGTLGIQMARLLGAEVTTSCSTANVQLCKDLGAAEVIDYKKDDIIQVLKSKGEIFDLVVDNVGSPPQLYKESHHFLKAGCNYIQVGAPMSMGGFATVAGKMLQPSWLGGGQRPYTMMGAHNSKEDYEQIIKWVAEGKVKVVIEQAFEWEDVPKAYEKLKTGRTKGKIVVHVTAK